MVLPVKKLQLENVTMLNAIPKLAVPQHINIADVALIPLKKKDTFKKVLPSKIFENAAMEKPILLGVEGEAKEVVESFNAGLAFEPENKADFLEKLDLIYRDKEQYKRFQKGGLILAKAFDREKLAKQMYIILDGVVYPAKNEISRINYAKNKR